MELTAIINKINSFLWGVPLLILLLGGGIYLSIKLGFPQIHILKIMKKTVFTLFKKESSESDSLSQFQTFSTALAATVGTGSVVGVGECIRIGGAGSVFWMWVSAFFGMGLAYCENYLGVRCSDGKLCGAASYLEKIGRTKLTAVLFAVFTVRPLEWATWCRRVRRLRLPERGLGYPHIYLHLWCLFSYF